LFFYGFYARGDYDDESGIDLMVLLDNEQVNTYREIHKNTDVGTELLLNYGFAVSFLPVVIKTYQISYGGVYQEAPNEGVVI
jgi:predicted nucleotidyltransferase